MTKDVNYVEDLEGFDDSEEPGYRLPTKVTCIKCNTSFGVRKTVYRTRVDKMLKKMFNLSMDVASKLDIDDEKFQQACKKLDDNYKCRVCRDKNYVAPTKIPILLEDGSTTTDYSCMED